MADLLMIADAINLPNSTSPQWGIFRNSQPVVIAQTIMDFNYKEEWALSDYPLEKGAFETYNKVYIPFDARFRFVSGENEENRTALLESIMAIAPDVNLYDVVTPTRIYRSVNITHYDYRRTSRNGLGLLHVDVWCLQVKVVVGKSGVGNTAAASGEAQQQGGTVQAENVPLPPERPPNLGTPLTGNTTGTGVLPSNMT